MKILKPINPNTTEKSGYVGKPENAPVPYVRISGELMKKFSFINDQIFDLGEYMFVPEELYKQVVNGHS